jgi:hypothetical protein
VFDRLLGAAARAIPDPRWRAEVVEVARASAEDAGPVGRARELAATAAFGLRLRSDRATGGDGRLAWRQGALLGAALLLAVAATGQVAVAQAPGAGAPAAAGALAIAAALAGAVVGRWRAAVGLAALALAVAEADAGRDHWDAVVAALVVAIAATVAAGRAGRATVVPGGRRWWLAVGAVGAAQLALGAAVAGATAVAATLLAPIVLVVLGGADARCAAAAAVAWGWRFLALDPGDVLDAGAALVDGRGLQPVLLRLAAMAWALGVAVAVTLRATRRAAAL